MHKATVHAGMIFAIAAQPPVGNCLMLTCLSLDDDEGKRDYDFVCLIISLPLLTQKVLQIDQTDCWLLEPLSPKWVKTQCLPCIFSVSSPFIFNETRWGAELQRPSPNVGQWRHLWQSLLCLELESILEMSVWSWDRFSFATSCIMSPRNRKIKHSVAIIMRDPVSFRPGAVWIGCD